MLYKFNSSIWVEMLKNFLADEMETCDERGMVLLNDG